jgi:hypothetical protein
MKKYMCGLFLITPTIMAFGCFGQEAGKMINRQSQAWVSINSVVRLTNKWGFVTDVHERRNHFFADPGFHFVRGGINYWVNDNLTVTAGYAHLWLAPTIRGWKTFADENRLYEQVQLVTKIGRLSMLQRVRNEQRWQEKIINDKATGDNKFTDRVRYLLYFTIPVFKNPKYPSLAVADELCIQFGKEIVYNTFDQNRAYLGIKQRLSKSLSFDLGYMLCLQQKATGNAYDENHTFRCFFYYMPDFRKTSHTIK